SAMAGCTPLGADDGAVRQPATWKSLSSTRSPRGPQRKGPGSVLSSRQDSRPDLGSRAQIRPSAANATVCDRAGRRSSQPGGSGVPSARKVVGEGVALALVGAAEGDEPLGAAAGGFEPVQAPSNASATKVAGTLLERMMTTGDRHYTSRDGGFRGRATPEAAQAPFGGVLHS